VVRGPVHPSASKQCVNVRKLDTRNIVHGNTQVVLRHTVQSFERGELRYETDIFSVLLRHNNPFINGRNIVDTYKRT